MDDFSPRCMYVGLDQVEFIKVGIVGAQMLIYKFLVDKHYSTNLDVFVKKKRRKVRVPRNASIKTDSLGVSGASI